MCVVSPKGCWCGIRCQQWPLCCCPIITPRLGNPLTCGGGRPERVGGLKHRNNRGKTATMCWPARKRRLLTLAVQNHQNAGMSKARNAARFADDRAGGRAVGQKETPDRLHEAVSGCGSVAGCWDVRAEKQNRCTESMGPSGGRPVEGEKVSGGATRRTAVVDRSKADRDSLGSGAVCVDKQNLEVNFLFVVFENQLFFLRFGRS